jgi:MFS family permease
MLMSTPASSPTTFAAFEHADFRYHVCGRLLMFTAHLMLNVAVGQHVYELTGDPLKLGYVGLALFLPKFGFSLIAGQVADRFDRRAIVAICRSLQLVASIFLLALILKAPNHLPGLYTLLFLTGTANAFEGPAGAALVPKLVPENLLGNALTWNSTTIQLALIMGPALAGLIYASGGAKAVFAAVFLMRLAALVLVLAIRTRTGRSHTGATDWQSLIAGLRFVYDQKIILGAISLDLFAVLLGGATALMPVFANDILKVGPQGLGYLRAAPSVGAALMAIFLAKYPPTKHAGPIMFLCVALFGLATIGFGLSTSFALSLFFLFILGASDMVSVVIRSVLIQVRTPESMRGRVNAVNLVFIGASNELGEFESGLTAALLGTVPAVIVGGLGTLAVVGLWSWRFPELRTLKKMHSE